MSPWFFFSYTFIPLSTIAFPHIAIFCLTAKRLVQFKRTVVFYPLCILAIWLPCVFLGVAANAMVDAPPIAAKLQARQALAAAPASMPAADRAALRRQAAGDDVIPIMLDWFAPLWLAGLLGAGIMAAVMASDSQILALSTMFTEDVFTFYGGTARFGETVQVQTGRAFVVVLTIVAYLIALRAPQSIFDLAVQYAFSGYAALSPLLVAALFWKRSTKWGALAVTVWVAAAVIYTARVPGALAWFGLLPVVPMTLISCRADGRRLAGDAGAVGGDAATLRVVDNCPDSRSSRIPREPFDDNRGGRRINVGFVGRVSTPLPNDFLWDFGTLRDLAELSVRRLVNLQRPGGIERPRIERAGPLLGGELRELRECLRRNARIAQARRQLAGDGEVLHAPGERLGRLAVAGAAAR